MVLSASDRHSSIWFCLGCLLFILTGCQPFTTGSHSTGSPAVIREAERESISTEPREENISQGAEAISRVAEDTPVVELSGLTQDAMGLLKQQEWWQAIDLAERGLRLEPRSTGLYRVLVEAYHSLGEEQRALSFARQGLRYCGRASPACDFMRHFKIQD